MLLSNLVNRLLVFYYLYRIVRVVLSNFVVVALLVPAAAAQVVVVVNTVPGTYSTGTWYQVQEGIVIKPFYKRERKGKDRRKEEEIHSAAVR